MRNEFVFADLSASLSASPECFTEKEGEELPAGTITNATFVYLCVFLGRERVQKKKKCTESYLFLAMPCLCSALPLCCFSNK